MLEHERRRRLRKVIPRQHARKVLLGVELLHDLVAPDDGAARVHQQARHGYLADHARRRAGVLAKDAVHQLLRAPLLAPQQQRQRDEHHERAPQRRERDQHAPAGQVRREPERADQAQRQHQRGDQIQL